MDTPVKFAVSVSKRSFKKAVQRNRIKRQIREIYRTSKHPLYTAAMEKKATVVCMFVFLGKEIPDNEVIQKALENITGRMIKKIHALANQ